ncbi:hypothetical protein [uncultured Porphyromonas sp.]|uniref:hypothetical protein n=1 Tax=uncultured Porphyromonas sp. TaxID=159274 RepID=UPI002618310E|nr:hypothetical protein [uncultured Porphyromonas sp.]
MRFTKNERLCGLLALAGVLSLCSCMEQNAPDATTSSLVSLDNASEPDVRMLDVSSDISLAEVVEEVPSDVLIAEYKQLRESGRLPLLSPSDRYHEYDAARELRDFALYDNISEMSKAGMTYSIRSVGHPEIYLTSSRLNTILTFQPRNSGSSSQKFEIRTHSLTSGMEYTIHSTGAYVGILGEGVLKSGSSKQYYATLFPMKESGMNYMAKNWKLVVDLDGRFKIINPDAIFFPTSQTARLNPSEYRLLEVGSNNRGEFNSEVSEDNPRSRNQLFTIEPNKLFEIKGVEYLDEKDHLPGVVSEVRPQGSTTVECSYTNPTSVYREQTVTFESVDLEENSNYDEYTDFKYAIVNIDKFTLKTPEVFDGSLQKKPSVNAPKLSRYKERQTIYRSLKDIAFRVEIPAKSRVTVRYSIPKYYVRCPYKLTLALKDDSNVRVAVYGYWSGDVHSMADAEDPEIIVETSSGTKKTYRLPISLIESGRTIKTSMLQQL